MRKFSLPALVFSLLFFSCSKPGDLKISRAMKSYQSKDYENALKLFEEALDEQSNYSPELINNFIANIYLQQDDLENAVIYQEKSCELHPEYRSLVSLGMTRHLLSQDDLAEEAYKKAVNLNPKKGEAFASLGALYISQGKYSDAIENLQKAAEFEEKIAVIHANLAVAYAASGDGENARKEFKIAESLKCENLDEFKERAAEFLPIEF
ncbi:tetratricopeptide repeat protein [uncultured Treponema sp.]|uniref:tetratricopeptide repeat protein n=1 Tax=uncultured Treponema sp. TaxID=162155 RepID=UPI0025E7953A|nr:tetratricopeptide repeat protein [uncultured Treponema sp.]